MTIVNWNKLNGITYKGYVIGAPSYNPTFKLYKINIYDLNSGFNGISDMYMTMIYVGNLFQLTLYFKDVNGQIGERVEVLNYDNVKTMDEFIKSYEVLIDWYEFKKRK